MGEIIHHNFGGSKSKKENDEELEKAKKDMELFYALLAKKGPTIKGKFNIATGRLEEMKTFFEHLRGAPPSIETRAFSQQLVSSLSFEETCDVVIGSSPNEWRTRPAYFMALSEWFSPLNMLKVLQEEEDNSKL